MKKEEIYIQRGENSDYPKEIRVWRKISKLSPPSWMTDICKVVSIDNGYYQLEVRKFNTGEYEYLAPDLTPIVHVSDDSDYICYGDINKYRKNYIFSLTPKQLNLLYKPKFKSD